MRLEGDILTLEQRFQLQLLRLELQSYGREELIQLLLEERQMLMIERCLYRRTLDEMGYDTSPPEGHWVEVPQSEKDLIEIFGKVPSDDELSDYLNERLEAARMDEIDIEAIALGLED